MDEEQKTDPIEAMLRPFRKLPGSPEMSAAREDWRERRRITAAIDALGWKVNVLLDALHWDTRNPVEGSEHDARQPLREFRAAVCALFSIELPLYTEPATQPTTHENQSTQGPGER
jgi:hypothetical protein